MLPLTRKRALAYLLSQSRHNHRSVDHVLRSRYECLSWETSNQIRRRHFAVEARTDNVFSEEATATAEVIAAQVFGGPTQKQGRKRLKRPSPTTSAPKGKARSVASSKESRKRAKRPKKEEKEEVKKKSSLPEFTRRIEGVIGVSENENGLLVDIESPSGTSEIPQLAHGLDRVLFNPGVHWVQDPRSRVYNFPPNIQTIPDVKDFAFERLPPYIRSSHDNDLYQLAVSNDRRFAGSTSSLTGILSQIYFLISSHKFVNTRSLSSYFGALPRNFTTGQKTPVSLGFHHRDGVYLIDSQSVDFDNNALNILTWMGTLLEKFLTYDSSSFSALMRNNPPPPETNSRKGEAYRYSKSNTFVMRSQLDCVDSRLPGTGVFDLKTRAAFPIRMDRLNYKENANYHLRRLQGVMESFEKEYYDLTRSAFLKYNFQARIGNMDGVLMAYHNTERIFGFQYVPLEEMDARLFGKEGRGWRVFDKCVGLLEVISEEIVACFPGKSVSCTVQSAESPKVMHVWVQPLPQDGDKSSTENGADDAEKSGETTAEENSTPIVQLDVRVRHFLGDESVPSGKAIMETDRPWTMQWSITRSSLPQAQIQRSLNAAKKKQMFPYSLPTGVALEDVTDMWRSMAITSDAADAGVPKALQGRLGEYFKNPSGMILKLRAFARKRAAEVERNLQADEEREKIVWRQKFSDDSPRKDVEESEEEPSSPTS